MTPPPRAAIYARISSDREGRELGVERQELEALELIERRGWQHARTWRENDVTATGKKPRPQFRDLLATVRRGEVDVIVAWNLHRLTRNARDRLELIEVCRDRGVLIALVRGSDLDPTTPGGRLHLGVLGEVAQHEVDELTDRVLSQKRQAAASGAYRGGRRPFGYERDGITVRTAEARIVVDLTARAAAGESLHALARELNRDGHTTSTGKPWNHRSVRNLVLRARNAGLIEHDRQVVGPAEWEPIVDAALWRNAVRVLTAEGRGPKWDRVEKYLGSGVYECGRCDDGATLKGRMTRTNSGGPGTTAPAYECTNGPHLTRIAEPLDEFVTAVVLERLSRPDARLLLAPEEARPDLDRLLGERQDVDGRLSELAALFADGTITGPQLAEATRKLRAEGERLDQAIAVAQGVSPLAGVADAEDVRVAWEAAAVSRRKAIVRALMRVVVMPAPKGRPAGWSPKDGRGYFDPRAVRIEPRV
ncbi:recombinase family protein [Pseudonocardia alni]|uniref:recombinase family protein n=1 Tax=Pseudonocardia alni TaxID=33907 RepID=UPI0033EB9BE9